MAERRVLISPSLARALVLYLRDAGHHERGGVLLGQRDEVSTRITSAIFPPQLVQNTAACSFDVSCLDAIGDAKSSLSSALERDAGTIIAWVHSHPRLGLFLSVTDQDTLASWKHLDPETIAVVADPFVRGALDEQIAWWDRQRNGHYVTLDWSGKYSLTVRQAADIAQALRDNAGVNGRWDVVAAWSVITVIVAPPDSPDPGRTG